MLVDERDCEIMQALHGNARMSLTDLSKRVGLSIDAVNKRMRKLIESKVFVPTILLRHRYCGFNNVVEVKIKLYNLDREDEFKRFIAYLKEHPRVTEVFSVAGEWDVSLVFICKDAIEQGKITTEIRSKFGRIINSWSESLTITAHKFEDYRFKRLFLDTTYD